MWLHLIIQLHNQFHLIFSYMINNFSNTKDLNMICLTAFVFNFCSAVSSSVSLFCLSNDQLSQTSHYLRNVKLTDTLSNLIAQMQQTVIVYKISGCYVIETHVHVSASGIWASIRGLDFRAIPPRRSDHYAA